MTDQAAPKGVHLLKELLFERETRRLDDLGRRVEQDVTEARRQHAVLAEQQAVQAHLQAEHARQQQDFDQKLTAVFERAGTGEKLQKSVAEIIDGSLREAEVVRHEALSRAIAPLIIRTIKVQLRESQDEMVEALYPITGRLVQSYVQSAVNEMMQKINAKLGGGGSLALTTQSSATGVPAGELAFAEANRLEVEELFLVRRTTGELVAHWERPGGGKTKAANGAGRPGDRDQLFSGYLSGIMSLSEEAFGAAPGSFRTLTLESGDRIFVRGSAAHLMAVRCSGSSGPEVERVIDEVFLEMIKRYQAALAADAVPPKDVSGDAVTRAATRAGGDVDRLLPEMSQSIEVLTQERRLALAAAQTQAVTEAAARTPSFGRVYGLAAILAAPFIAWGLWSLWQTMETTRAEEGARRVLAETDEIRGVPPRVEVERGGRSLTISGFVPTGALRDQILARLAREVPQAQVRDQLGVLPAGSGPSEIALAELRREIEQQQGRAELARLTRSLTHATARLADVRAGVAALAPRTDGAERAAIDQIGRLLDDGQRDVARAKAVVDRGGATAAVLTEPLTAAWTTLRQLEGRLAALVGTTNDATQAPGGSAPLALDVLAEDVAMAAERMAAGQSALRLRAVPTQVSALKAQVERLRAPTAREAFDALARTNAVFFDNGTEFRNAEQARTIIDALAREMQALGDVVLRVVGYTDEKGGQALNSGLAQARADRVATELVGRGIAANRVVAVGRLTGKELSRAAGQGSANRRVEFEIGFAGEAGSAP